MTEVSELTRQAPAIDEPGPRTATAVADRHVAHIDGLRAVAVSAVIAYHMNVLGMGGGLRGVDLFFVISGFVVATSVTRWQGATLVEFAGNFYRRRLLRIAPALLTVLLVITLASMLLIPETWLGSANDKTGVYAFFGLSNLYLAHHSASYFSPIAEYNPFLHTWSLGVEEQFYILFPPLFFAWLRRGITRLISVAAFTLVFVGSLAYYWKHAPSQPLESFFLTQGRLWEIAAGVLLYFATTQLRRWTGVWDKLAEAAAWLFLGLLGYALWEHAQGRAPTLTVVVAAVGLLATLHGRGEASPLARLLGLAPLQTVGARSYSLYLWHWPVFVLMRWTLGFESTGEKLLALAVAVGLAEASFRWVERPVRQQPRLRRAQPWRIVPLGLAVVLLAAGVGHEIRSVASAASLSTVTRHRSDWQSLPNETLASDPGCHLATRVVPALSATEYRPVGCHGNARSGHTLYVVGDSHAAAYTGVATEHVLRTGATAVVYSLPGCEVTGLRPGGETPFCLQYAQWVFADITQRSHPGDVLLSSTLRVPRLREQWQTTAGPPIPQLDDAARRHVEADVVGELMPLTRRGISVVFEAPTPVFRAVPYRCSDAFNDMNPICSGGLSISRSELDSYRAVALTGELRVVAALPGARIFDPVPTLCDASRCDAVPHGHPLFFDGDHLSGLGNVLLYPAINPYLTGAQA